MLPTGIADERRNLTAPLNPAWIAFINYCDRLGHGEIGKLKIQDGLPVVAEITTQKVKFS